MINQTVVLAVSVPFFLAGAGALWPATTLGTRWSRREAERQDRTRQILVARSISFLRDLRPTLDQLFHEADEGNDPYLKRVDPNRVAEPVREFSRLMHLQQSLVRYTSRARTAARQSFWALLVFDILSLATVILGVSQALVGDVWPIIALVAMGVALLVGGVVFCRVLFAVRAIEGVHAAADEPDDVEDGAGRSYEDLLGSEE